MHRQWRLTTPEEGRGGVHDLVRITQVMYSPLMIQVLYDVGHVGVEWVSFRAGAHQFTSELDITFLLGEDSEKSREDAIYSEATIDSLLIAGQITAGNAEDQ